MFSTRNSGRGRGLSVLVFVLLAALLPMMMKAPALAATQTAVGTNNLFTQMFSALPTAALAAAEGDEYVRATRTDPNAEVAPGVLARSSTGAGIVYPGGPGHPTRVFAVKWFSDDRSGWCYRFGLRNPDSNGVNLVSQIPGMTADESKHVFYVVNKYQGTTSDVTAAAVAFVVWHYEDSDGFRQWFTWAKNNNHIGSAVLGAYNRILKESKQHGPYKMSMEITKKAVAVGQTGRAVVTVKNAHGAVSGRKVTVSGTNAKGTRSSWTTNNKGKAEIRFTRTDVDRVRLVAKTTTHGIKGYLTSPSDGNQSLVLYGPSYTATTAAGYQAEVKGPKVTAECSTDCDGTAPVTVNGCVPRGSDPVRFFIGTEDQGRGTMDVREGNCNKLTKTFMDDDQVIVEMCYIKNDQCKTDRVRVATYRVVCPPGAEGELVTTTVATCKNCASTTNSLRYRVSYPTTRFYTGTYRVNEGEWMEFRFPADGQWHEITGLPAGTVTEFGYRVYRNPDRTGKLADVVYACPTCD